MRQPATAQRPRPCAISHARVGDATVSYALSELAVDPHPFGHLARSLVHAESGNDRPTIGLRLVLTHLSLPFEHGDLDLDSELPISRRAMLVIGDGAYDRSRIR
jgi:hypothetical protein